MRFAYHRSLAPMIWALIGISVVELGLVHLLVALLWSRWVALGLSLVTLGTILWLVRLIRSFRTAPVEIEGDRLLLRVGDLKAIALKRADVLRLRGDFTGAQIKAPGMLKLSLLAYPNIVVDLAAPVQVGRRRIVAVAHRLDDAPAFAKAFAAWQAAT
jgi:hypothetical protein